VHFHVCAVWQMRRRQVRIRQVMSRDARAQAGEVVRARIRYTSYWCGRAGARARTIDRLALAEVGIVRRAEDAAAEAAQQALEVAVVNVAEQHLRAEVGMHVVSDGRV
jgi:hypothetical protein